MICTLPHFTGGLFMKCYRSDKDVQFQETEVNFANGSSGEMQQVHVYPEAVYQKILGIGGAFTEAAAYTYSRMSQEKQQQLLDLYFGSNNNYNFCRLHIQSSVSFF